MKRFDFFWLFFWKIEKHIFRLRNQINVVLVSKINWIFRISNVYYVIFQISICWIRSIFNRFFCLMFFGLNFSDFLFVCWKICFRNPETILNNFLIQFQLNDDDLKENEKLKILSFIFFYFFLFSSLFVCLLWNSLCFRFVHNLVSLENWTKQTR